MKKIMSDAHCGISNNYPSIFLSSPAVYELQCGT
jgi:hypothetical protein